jgi:hypothetical protein
VAFIRKDWLGMAHPVYDLVRDGGGSGGSYSGKTLDPSRAEIPGYEEAVASASIPIYDVGEQILSSHDRRNPQLTLVARNLTSPDELRKVEQAAKDLRYDRKPGEMIFVIGPGAHYSSRFPYRPPEATEIRSGLWNQGIFLIEQPEDVHDKPGIREFMAKRFAEAKAR